MKNMQQTLDSVINNIQVASAEVTWRAEDVAAKDKRRIGEALVLLGAVESDMMKSIDRMAKARQLLGLAERPGETVYSGGWTDDTADILRMVKRLKAAGIDAKHTDTSPYVNELELRVEVGDLDKARQWLREHNESYIADVLGKE